MVKKQSSRNDTDLYVYFEEPKLSSFFGVHLKEEEKDDVGPLM